MGKQFTEREWSGRNYTSMGKTEIQMLLHRIGRDDLFKAGFIEFEAEEEKADNVCGECGKECASLAGLRAHQRRHK